MTREEKRQVIEELKEKFQSASHIYVVDSSGLTVENINMIRRKCHEKGIEIKVVKNTLAIKAIEAIEKDGLKELIPIFRGPSTIMISESPNGPARLIKEVRKTLDKPILKAAYIESAIYVGDEMLDTVASLKSKEELIGDIILLLQSPMRNVLGALQSGGHKLAGILQALKERGESA